MRIITAILFVLSLASFTSAMPKTTFISYDFSETRLTESDHRECITQIFISADGYIGYRYREDVFGATTPLVRTTSFSNEYQRKITKEEEEDLIRQLLEANVFEVKSDPESSSRNYSSYFYVRIAGQEGRFFFYTAPQTPARKLIHKIMIQFAKKAKIDHPEDQIKSTITSEGDWQPAQQVKFSDLLADPGKYHGKRISVVGYYHGEFEGSSLSLDEKSSRSYDFKKSLWRGEPSTFAKAEAIKDKNDSWLRVEGVFLRGPCGHMGLWPGEIVRLTLIEPMHPPN